MKKCSGYYIAKCPAHEDKHQSLSVSQGDDGKILVRCHAGCSATAIVGAMGLQVKDLFPDRPPEKKGFTVDYGGKRQSRKEPQQWQPRGTIVASYEYRDDSGKLLAIKDRYENKFMSWRHPDGSGGWLNGSGGAELPLYKHECIGNPVYLVEGEKDVDTLRAAGLHAVCNPNGAAEKWCPRYTEQLRGFDVRVIPDNDEPGRRHAEEVCRALIGSAVSVRLVDLSELWPDIPDKADVTDWIEWSREQGRSDEKIIQCLTVYADGTPEFQPDMVAPPEPEQGKALTLFKPVSAFEEQEAKWLISGWLPEGQVVILASDGGIGKTTVTCDVGAAVSNGSRCILDSEDVQREPRTVMILTTEDSISKKLKKKLRLLGAKQENIIAPDPSEDVNNELRDLKFGSPLMAQAIRKFKPALCIIDPVQGYVPPEINMGSRNAMRDCMSTLTALGEETGCTFLVVCHSNKRRGAFGRDRISDSSDLWDIARSVIMAGYAEGKEIRYLSNEKNNYAKLQKTVLFSIGENGLPKFEGYSDKRDREFLLESLHVEKQPEPLNERLLEALKDAANPFDAVKFSYTGFEEQYGATIYGGKQPKKALDLMKPHMEDAGYSLVVKDVKINKKSAKGFVIQPINEESEQLTV